jgi:hypothetical protein
MGLRLNAAGVSLLVPQKCRAAEVREGAALPPLWVGGRCRAARVTAPLFAVPQAVPQEREKRREADQGDAPLMLRSDTVWRGMAP